ncbi:Hypothetical_protein [Hexamita inflata]|uniref:Hypothetical_protein n=1 Tax=Hexamita inflata TaxID=28002 RepID=A0AA86TPK2_9EUKA|nr:Hypothetical protein HINF_LOCUS6468 [Hexamita inflata]
MILQLVINFNTGMVKRASVCIGDGASHSDVGTCDCPENQTKYTPVQGAYICVCQKRRSGSICMNTCNEVNQVCLNPPCICSSCTSPLVQNSASSQCVSCQTNDPLSISSGIGCACTANTDPFSQYPNCACKQNYTNIQGRCLCSQQYYQSSDNQSCVLQCNQKEIRFSYDIMNYCLLCSNNQVPNVAKTMCVDRLCNNSFLNQEGTFCVQSCENGQPNANNQCQLCTSFTNLSHFNQSFGQCECDSTANQWYQFPNCQCYENYVIEGSTCVCLLMKAANGFGCVPSCPADQLSNSSSRQCSICSANLVPNSAKNQCVPRTCGSEFLNIAGTYCVTCCLSLEAVPNADRQCVFCPIKISQNQQNCITACPPTQISNHKLCQTCSIDTVPNVYKNSCVSPSSCGSGFLNVARTFCVSSCLTEFGYPSGTRCLLCNNQTQLGVWASFSCTCSSGFGVVGVFPECSCHSSFVQQGALCSCSQKVSSDGSQCLSSRLPSLPRGGGPVLLVSKWHLSEPGLD